MIFDHYYLKKQKMLKIEELEAWDNEALAKTGTIIDCVEKKDKITVTFPKELKLVGGDEE